MQSNSGLWCDGHHQVLSLYCSSEGPINQICTYCWSSDYVDDLIEKLLFSKTVVTV